MGHGDALGSATLRWEAALTGRSRLVRVWGWWGWKTGGDGEAPPRLDRDRLSAPNSRKEPSHDVLPKDETVQHSLGPRAHGVRDRDTRSGAACAGTHRST